VIDSLNGAQPEPDPRPIRVMVTDPDLVPRRVDCAHYQRCLNIAEAKRWLGFDCFAACRAYEAMSPERQQQERIAILRVLKESCQ
jgi:hypothetical protein